MTPAISPVHFAELIGHLQRKKPKKGENGYFGIPQIEIYKDNLLIIDYNYYHVTVLYDPDNKMPRPMYSPYRLYIEKPCVIHQQLGTAFCESWWATQKDVWLELQSKWAKTII